MTARRLSLAELARRFALVRANGTGAVPIVGACALVPGRAGHIAYAEHPRQAQGLARTAAAAAIVPEALAAGATVPVLISAQPKLAFARVAALFEARPPAPGVHQSAVIEPTAWLAPSVYIGAQVVVGARSRIAAGAVIGPGCVLGDDVYIGADSRIAANVCLEARTKIGARARIEAGAIIGARGFGLVCNGQGWEAMPQFGGVAIADDVEIGAGTTIDCGAFEDTRIDSGVKIDDQVHIGHNCVVGAHTVIAGATAIAGSCTIGCHCMIGGGVGIGDHVRIADGVVLTAASQVPKSIETAGVYSSTFWAMPARAWRRRLALFRRLDRIQWWLARGDHRDESNGARQ